MATSETWGPARAGPQSFPAFPSGGIGHDQPMARAALIVTLAALMGAGTALSSGKPSLRVQSRGAVVVGSHFRAGEMVTVTLVTGTGARKARVRAAGGVFRVGFRVPRRAAEPPTPFRRGVRAARRPPRLRRPAGLRAAARD